MGRIRRIVHPSDFSRASNAAFGKAVEMAKANRAELLLVHVLVPFVPAMGGDGYVSPQVYAEIEASSNAYARKELDALAAKAKKIGVRTSVLVSEGAPAERIAHLARSKRADVVVLGTHGRTGLARMFLGSVASRVISIATCPVLTVRGK